MKRIVLVAISIASIFSFIIGKSQQIQIEERIVDSLNLGNPGQFKISIHQIRKNSDEVFVEFELFEKQNRYWIKKQTHQTQKDGITPLDLKFSDFNGDGLNDMTFRSGVAARGANEIRTLFLFDKGKGELTEIKNSSRYPNLLYNKELGCIDAWLVYGGSSTVFLHLENDSLKEFAEVQLFGDTLRVKELDKNNKWKVLKKEKMDWGDSYQRFKNYKPLKASN